MHSSSPHSSAVRLRWIYKLSLGVIMIAALCSHVVMHRFLNYQETANHISTTMGHQRMLIQKISKLSLQITYSGDLQQHQRYIHQLQDALHTWARIHQGLQNGDVQLKLPGNNSPAILALFSQLEPHYRAFYDAAYSLTTTSPDSAVSAYLADIQAHEPVVARYTAALTATYAQQTQSSAAFVAKVEYVMAAILLLALLVEVLLIFRPAMQRMSDYFTALYQSNLQLTELNTALSSMHSKHEEAQRQLELTLHELVEKEKLITAVTKATPDILYIYDLVNQQNVFVNKNLAAILGYPAQEITELGKDFLEKLLHSDDLPSFRQHLQAISQVKGQEVVQVDYRLQHKDGHFIWLHSRNIVFERHSDGTPTRILGLAQDITERRLVEDKFITSEQQYRSIVESVKEVVFQTDNDGKWQFLNPAWTEMTGFSIAESLGQYFFEYVHPEDREYNQSLFLPLIARQKEFCRHEVRYLTKDGGFRWVSVLARLTINEANQIVGTSGTLMDVTERRAAEDKLRKSEQLYRLISENSRDLITLNDAQGNSLYISPSVKEVLGFTAEELLGTNPFDYMHPADATRIKQQTYTGANKDGLQQLIEYRTQKKDGSYIWLETHVRSIRDESGNLINLQTTSRDVSMRKQSEQNLTQLSSWLMSILYSSLTGILAFKASRDLNGEISDFECLMVNPKTEQLLGMKAEKLIGNGMLEVFPLREAGLFDKCKKVVESGQLWESDSYSISIDLFPQRWFHVVAVKIEDGCAVMFTDITRQKQAQMATILQKERMEQVYRITSNASIDIEAQIFETLKTATESLGLKIGMFSRVENDISTIEEVYTTTYKGFHKGLFVPLNSTYCHIPYHQDRLVAISDVLNCDFMDQSCYEAHKFESYIGVPVWVRGKKYGVLMFSANYPLPDGFTQGDEDFVLMLSQWMGSALDRHTYEVELVRAKEQAEHSSKAKEQFLSTMSHEIRTPMNAVIGMTHLLLQESPRPEQLDNLKTLQFSAENLLVLINDILDFSKIEAGMVTFEKIDFSLPSLIESIKYSLLSKAHEKQIHLHVNLDTQIPDALEGDPVRLSQVLINLLSNAIKFTEQGTVTLDILLTKVEANEIALCFSITDTGIGIPEDKLEYIFERFTQAQSDTTRKFGGTGLGLAISKRLLEMQGSQIRVTSQLGKGSTFFFTLSFKKGNSKAITTLGNQSAIAPGSLKHLRLLLVEDNEINRKVASKFLNQWGIQPDYAIDGLKAVASVQEKEYDIILMDLQMPEMDGYEATRIIRTMKAGSGVPILALTASAMHEVAKQVFDAGMNDFITKPFNPNDLYQKIAKYTSRHEVILQPEPATVETREAEVSLLNIDGLVEFVGERGAFLEEMIDLHIQMFERLADEYRQALLNKDKKQLNFIFHRVKTALAVLSITALEQEYRKAQELLSTETTQQQLQDSTDRVVTICTQICHQLREEKNKLAV